MGDIERMAESIQHHIRIIKRLAAAERRAYPDIYSMHAWHEGKLAGLRLLHTELWEMKHGRLAWSSYGELREWRREQQRKALVAAAAAAYRAGTVAPVTGR